MRAEEVIRKLERKEGLPGFDELKRELGLGALRHVSSGEMSAREAIATFGIRHRTTRKAGVETIGFDDSLRALASEPEETSIRLHHFKSANGIFTVFAVDARVIGCIRVPQR